MDVTVPMLAGDFVEVFVVWCCDDAPGTQTLDVEVDGGVEPTFTMSYLSAE